MKSISNIVDGDQQNLLSKWFDSDVLEKLPQNPNAKLPNGKVLSLDEIENQ